MNDDNHEDLFVMFIVTFILVILLFTALHNIFSGKYDPTTQIVSFDSVQSQIVAERDAFP